MSPEVTEEYREFRQRQILMAAWRSFAEKGIRGTTIRGIAEVLGLSTGVVYTYFESKEEIVRALQDMSLRQNQQLLGRMAEQESPREALEDLFSFLLECSSGEAFRLDARANLVSWAEALNDDIFRAGLAATLEPVRDGLAEICRRGVELGELSSGLDPDGFAGLISALVLGVQVQAALLADLDPTPLLQTAKKLLEK